MTWRAHIDSRDVFMRHLRVTLVDEWPGGYTLLGPGGEVATQVTDPDALGTEPTPPTLLLPSGADHALLAALARHLGAVEHPQQLRKDYDAERARVDRLIDLATRPPLVVGGAS